MDRLWRVSPWVDPKILLELPGGFVIRACATFQRREGYRGEKKKKTWKRGFFVVARR